MGLLSSLGFLQQGLFQPQQQQPFSPYFGAEQQPPIAQPQPRRAMTQPGIPALPEQISPMQSSAAAPLSAPNAPGASPNVNFMDRIFLNLLDSEIVCKLLCFFCFVVCIIDIFSET